MAESEKFITWADPSTDQGTSLNQAIAAFGETYKDYNISRSHRQDFRNIDTNVSVRPGFTSREYEYFRPYEAMPVGQKESIEKSIEACKSVGIVSKVIGLMAEFASHGIKLVHQSKSQEKFFNAWFETVRGPERSERFLSLLYKTANVVVHRSTAKLKNKDLLNVQRVTAEEQDVIRTPVKLPEGEIPWKYTFLNPLNLEVISPEAVNFFEKPQLAMKISRDLTRKVLYPKNDIEAKLRQQLPKAILTAIANQETEYPLDPNTISVIYYKKDDWEVWAYPLIHPILKDINLYNKLKLTDLAACDGAIANVRLWRIGSLEHKILPNKAIIEKLSAILNNNVGGGVVDLVWGPELDFKESNSDIHKYLGISKYEPTLNAIYAGLGIPSSLTGTGNTGFTNNAVSLKTFIEQLNYGRRLLTGFWEQEIALVQRAMGFRYAAKVVYGSSVMSDEAAEKKLLIELADRDIISMDTVLDRFGEFPDLERQRLRRERTERKKAKLPPKTSPYHQPQQKHALEKIFAQRGAVTPSELGLELKDKKKGEVSAMELQAKTAVKTAQMRPQEGFPRKNKPVGVKGQGRPKNSKDSVTRKKKVVKPRTVAMLQVWTENALNTINDQLLPFVLEKHSKSNLRQLTNEQFDEFEQLKFYTLCGIQPFLDVTDEVIGQSLSQVENVDSSVGEQLQQLKDEFSVQFKRDPTVAECRKLQTLVYYSSWVESIGDENGENLS